MALTKSQTELLDYLSTRKGVVPVRPERRDDLLALHRFGLVATHGDFACITDEGHAALRDAEGGLAR